jgi:hypothetical protein
MGNILFGYFSCVVDHTYCFYFVKRSNWNSGCCFWFFYVDFSNRDEVDEKMVAEEGYGDNSEIDYEAVEARIKLELYKLERRLDLLEEAKTVRYETLRLEFDV